MPVSHTFPDTLPNPTSDSFGYDEEPRVKVAQFGDGYEQRAPDGINALARNWTLTFEPMTKAQRNILRDFCRARKGSEPFYWDTPDDDETVVVKATKWSIRRMSGDNWSVVVTFKEVFDV